MNGRIARLSFSLVSFVLLCFTIAASQEAAPPQPLPPPAPGTATTTMRFPPSFVGHMRPVTGAPYCADQVSERVQTLADGTHITSDNRTIKECRDSAGRTRREEPLLLGGNGRQASPVLIHIDDPVANVRYILDPQNKVAHRHALNRNDNEATGTNAGSATGEAAPRLNPGASETRFPRSTAKTGEKSDVPRPRTISESLGKETIEGVIANGTRTTTTYPVGAVGNDREFTTTHEYWMSRELNLEVLSKAVDPRQGDETRKLINISTSEPDPSLFQVPEGYTVSDDEEFRMEWRMPPQ